MSKNIITIVINTFKSEDKIYSCLDSISSDYKKIIIENSNNISFKNSIDSKYLNLECILTGEKLGYANGNNLGLSKVKSKYALILNPDAVLDKNTIGNFLASVDKINDFAILGPAKQDEFSKVDIFKDKENLFEVDQLKGFAMFLNLKEFKDIGFFDKNFFIYLEEIDLCKRIREKNKKIYLDKNIIIHHLGGSSHNESINLEMELSRNWHWMWSTFYFNKKHYGYFSALISISGKFFSSLFKMFFYLIIFNKEKRQIYFQRFTGLLNSIIGKKSWYRPKVKIN